MTTAHWRAPAGTRTDSEESAAVMTSRASYGWISDLALGLVHYTVGLLLLLLLPAPAVAGSVQQLDCSVVASLGEQYCWHSWLGEEGDMVHSVAASEERWAGVTSSQMWGVEIGWEKCFWDFGAFELESAGLFLSVLLPRSSHLGTLWLKSQFLSHDHTLLHQIVFFPKGIALSR